MNKPITHFGITMKLKRGHELTGENYAAVSNKSTTGKSPLYIKALKENNEKLINSYSKIYADKEGLIYTYEWCEDHLIKVMKNFDLNMQFFKKLDNKKFNAEVLSFLKRTDFYEIEDLNEYSIPGYYVLILDKYCQIYIGTTKDIKRRIRQHWGGGKMKFDRLIFGSNSTSKLAIDSFRVLDTTRILVYPNIDLYHEEDDFINFFSKEFICNRISGGIMEFGALSVLNNTKKRDLE